MNELNFCYWLQGYFEISELEGKQLSPEMQVIKDHLKLVFNKETPDRTKQDWKLEDYIRKYSTNAPPDCNDFFYDNLHASC
jgi:hypothetical protein